MREPPTNQPDIPTPFPRNKSLGRLWLIRCMSVKWSWCNNLSRCDFLFFIERFVCCMTHEVKLSILIQWPCSSDFHRFARDCCFVVNTLTVFLSFCYIECKLFAVFIKILFDNWRRFCRPSVIYVPVKCPQGGGIWSPEWTLVWGIWTAFWPG